MASGSGDDGTIVMNTDDLASLFHGSGSALVENEGDANLSSGILAELPPGQLYSDKQHPFGMQPQEPQQQQQQPVQAPSAAAQQSQQAHHLEHHAHHVVANTAQQSASQMPYPALGQAQAGHYSQPSPSGFMGTRGPLEPAPGMPAMPMGGIMPRPGDPMMGSMAPVLGGPPTGPGPGQQSIRLLPNRQVPFGSLYPGLMAGPTPPLFNSAMQPVPGVAPGGQPSVPQLPGTDANAPGSAMAANFSAQMGLSPTSGVGLDDEGGAKDGVADRRRHERNLREQRRSYRISQQIEQLHGLLDRSGVSVKGNKFSILAGVAHYIKALEQRTTALDNERQQYIALLGSMTERSVGESLSQRDYRDAFINSSIPMAIASVEGRFIEVNRLFEDVSGYTTEELEGLTIFNLSHPDSLQDCFNLVGSMLNKDSTVHGPIFKRALCKNVADSLSSKDASDKADVEISGTFPAHATRDGSSGSGSGSGGSTTGQAVEEKSGQGEADQSDDEEGGFAQGKSAKSESSQTQGARSGGDATPSKDPEIMLVISLVRADDGSPEYFHVCLLERR